MKSNLDRQVMERVMGWRRGKYMKPHGGCCPQDAKVTPVGGWIGAISRGGNMPYFIGESKNLTVFRHSFGERWSPSTDMNDAVEALECSGLTFILLTKFGKAFQCEVSEHQFIGNGATMPMAITQALLKACPKGSPIGRGARDLISHWTKHRASEDRRKDRK